MKVILLYLCSVYLVAANPLLQSPSTQQHTPQNVYKKPTNTGSVQTSSNITPYSQSSMIQNQATPPQASESMFENIFSNPIFLQALLSAKANNKNNMKKQSTNPTSAGVVPQVINNYYIIPGEYLKLNDTKDAEKLKEELRDGLSISSNKDIQRNEIKNSQSETNKNQESNQNKRNRRRKRKRNRQKNNALENTNLANNTNMMDTKDANQVALENQNIESPLVFDQGNITNEENLRTKAMQRPKRRRKVKQNKVVDEAPTDASRDFKTYNTDQFLNQEDLIPFVESESKQESRVTRNLKDSNIANMYNLPALPEEVARNFYANLNQQGGNIFGNLMPFGFERIYQVTESRGSSDDQLLNKTRKRKHRRRRPHRRRKEKKIQTDVIDSLSTKNEIATIKQNYETTEQPINEKLPDTQDSLKFNFISKSEPSLNVPEKNNNIDKTKVFKLKEEGTIPIIYENDIINDDYYPIFTDNGVYYGNNKKYMINDVSDRFYYTTDKNIDHDDVKLLQKENKFSRNMYKDQERNGFENLIEDKAKKLMADGSSSNIKQRYPIQSERSEEILFRPPPFLESPDFITKEIDKGHLRHESYGSYKKLNDDYEDDSIFHWDDKNVNSDAKIFKFNNKKDEIIISKPKNPDVETFYARSKVVQYGQNQDYKDKQTITPAPRLVAENKSKHYNGVVMAKSLGQAEDYW